MAKVKDNSDHNDDLDILDQDGFTPVYNINNTFWDTIEKNVPKNTNKFIRFVQAFRDANINKLETPYPVDYPIWRPDCERIIYNTLGIDPDDLYKITSNIELPNDYKDKYLVKGNSRTVMLIQFALFMLYRYYLIHKKEKEMEICKYFMAYFFYFSLFTKYFKYKPNKDIMAYTINSMSFKNQIKQTGSVNKWIHGMITASCDKYEPIIIRGADTDYYKCIRRTLTKFNDAMNNLFSMFMKDWENRNAIFTSKAMDDDGEMMDQSSLSSDIIQLADKYTTRFFENPNSEEVIAYVCDKKQKGGYIPERDLRNTIFNIADDSSNQDDVRTFYQSVFFLFFHNSSNNKYEVKDVNSMKFMLEMQKMYKAGNSINKNRIIIGNIIDKWLKIGSQTYRSTNREATKSIFKRSIFDYFIIKVTLDK